MDVLFYIENERRYWKWKTKKRKKNEASNQMERDRYRTDKRRGAISPVEPSLYVQYAYDELERQFPKEEGGARTHV
ncbi:hypothetical protein NST21_09705 [Peribacillus sp. FSL K6-1552]|uniref:hypothetical protein n=1 Tax=Peribacillus sp. FSL K6-1552 TaxID=2954514 RepID=UPI0030FC465E